MSKIIIQPDFLVPGDTIAIAATARKINEGELNFAIDIIQQKKYNVVLAQNIFLNYHQFAGNDEERAEAFQQLLNHKDIKAIFIARGGYGTVRILDRLNYTPLLDYPKWICGFSDITALHAHLYNKGIKTIHSTMPLLFHQYLPATDALFDLLKGNKQEYSIIPHQFNRINSAFEGEIVGGNLSVLYSLTGSLSELNLKNKILFIEDIDEYLYHIDRMMQQFKRSGQLKHLKGLIVGGFSDMKDNTIPFGKSAEEIIFDAVKEYDYPLVFNFPAGHILHNMPFIHGGKISFYMNKNELKCIVG